MAELLFERLGVALETVSGTAIAAPTHYLPMSGVLSPRQTVNRPTESRGTRAQYYRSRVVKKWSEWSAEGAIDVYNLPVLLNMAVAANATPTTPGGGTTTRLWTFVASQSSVTEKTGTMFWGDPNVQSFRAPYGVVDGFTLGADATGDDSATMSFTGRAQVMEKIAAPTYPTMLVGPMITPLDSQLWMDTSSAIGTTAITGRVLAATFSVDGLRGDPKYMFAGPGSSKTYQRFGATARSATLALRFELFDAVEYDLLMAETVVKARVRMNGPLIEGALYHYVEVDIYGILDAPDWSDAFGSNRVLDVTITSQYDTTAAHDWAIRVQNDKATL